MDCAEELIDSPADVVLWRFPSAWAAVIFDNREYSVSCDELARMRANRVFTYQSVTSLSMSWPLHATHLQAESFYR